MAWAMLSALLVAPLALEGASHWTPNLGRRWEELHRCRIVRRQRICRIVRRLLRWPRAVAAAVSLLGRAPWLAAPLTSSMNRMPVR